jgi:hypothetical protein
MDRRWVSAAVVVAIALLAVSAQPVAALNTAVYKHYTTADDFQSNGQFVKGVAFESTGDAGHVEHVGQFDDSLQAHLQFNEGSGSTTTDRERGTSYNINGASWVTGVEGSALKFDAAGEEVPLGTPVSASTGELTISAWVKTTDSDGFENIVSRGKDEIFLGHRPDGTVSFFTDHNGAKAISSTSVNDGNWHHVAGVYDAPDGELRIYVDGDLEATAGVSSDIPSSTTDWAVNSETLNASIDQVRIYDRATETFEVDNVAENPTFRLDTQAIYVTQPVAMPTNGTAHFDVTLQNATGVIQVRGINETDNSWDQIGARRVVSSTANHTIDFDPGKYDRVNFAFEPNATQGDYEARLDELVVERQNRAPEMNELSASPDGTAQSDSTLSINVSDPDFGTGVGESVTVSFYDASDDSLIGTDTLGSNGTATTTWDGVSTGSQEWYVEATDNFSRSVGPTQSFTWPIAGELKIFYEREPNTLITDENITLTVRFYRRGETEVRQRFADNGTVDLSGLPADKRFIVTVQANSTQFTYRRIVLDSVIETNRVYLLEDQANASEVIFELDDSTGEFSGDSTTLYVEKALNVSGEPQYEVIAGDEFGAAGEFPVVLQTDERYRLRVENADGDIKRLGPFTTSGDERVPLPITSVVVEDDTNSTAVAFGTRLEQTDAGPVIRLKYADPTETTSSLRVEIVTANGTVIRPNGTTTLSGGTYTETVGVSSMDGQYEVRWYAERSEANAGGTEKLGSLPPLLDRFGQVIPSELLMLGGWLIVLGGTGAVVIVDQRLAAVVAPVLAGSMVVLGAFELNSFFLSLALGVGVVMRIGEVGP